MDANEMALIILLVPVVLFILYCPIFKPWFGFRKPPDHKGHWFE